MTEGEVIDRAVLDDLLKTVGGDRSFLAELIDGYFDDTPRQLALMRWALEVGNAAELRRAAHTLKSNSSNFGATALSSMCKELEALGKSGELAAAPRRGTLAEQIEQIETEYTRVRYALQALQAAYLPI
jgi:HPt (histidine-containing phosphotransfer) domain-containing protein